MGILEIQGVLEIWGHRVSPLQTSSSSERSLSSSTYPQISTGHAQLTHSNGSVGRAILKADTGICCEMGSIATFFSVQARPSRQAGPHGLWWAHATSPLIVRRW